MTKMRTVSAILPLDGAAASSWPLRSGLDLEARPEAVPRARRHSRLVMTGWGLAALADPVEQVVAELVANARTAAEPLPEGAAGSGSAAILPVRLWLASDHTRVLIQVWDRAATMPVRQELDPESETGRGLWLVESLCEHWGAIRSRDVAGKTVWGLIQP